MNHGLRTYEHYALGGEESMYTNFWKHFSYCKTIYFRPFVVEA